MSKIIRENTPNISPGKPLDGTCGPSLPYVLVGGEAFELSTNLLRPYGGKDLSKKKRIFNYRLCGARRFIECTFSILSNKWRILHRPLNVSIVFADDIVRACCVFDNFVR
ncbi:hypothetical protein Cfor_00474 [Coptotermes formosanus]|uniref:DDE Tnp4 domain-containing protein n=1 Tax=Coptotermes formosanus TaxID=36987 RepID=A0A6L2PNL7_COPFO|nr:hypothetical protein Cfor_00474 [Coptotermes formosanus]